MYNQKRVVAVVPAGRAKYLEILVHYLRANSHILDVCHLWCNTEDPDDIEYLHQLADADDGFFQFVAPIIPVDGTMSIYHFFRYCCEAETIYIRFDDDICWIAPDAIETLVRFRIDNPEYFLVYTNTINNSICSYLHQRIGCLGTEAGVCEYDVLGRVSHRSPELARAAHLTFLDAVERKDVDRYHFPRWIAWEFERISINCICWSGSAFAEFNGNVGPDEEVWLSQEKPRQIGRPNAICGGAIAAHFAYYTQREWLEANTDLLDRYGELARNAEGRGKREEGRGKRGEGRYQPGSYRE
jgi:hypothetical protein